MLTRFKIIIEIFKNPLYYLQTGRTRDRYIMKSDYPRKKSEDFSLGESFIVVGFTKQQYPICQLVSDLQDDMSNHFTSDKTFFTLDKDSVQELKSGKTYQLIKLDSEGARAWQQVAMFIEADCVIG